MVSAQVIVVGSHVETIVDPQQAKKCVVTDDTDTKRISLDVICGRSSIVACYLPAFRFEMTLAVVGQLSVQPGIIPAGHCEPAFRRPRFVMITNPLGEGAATFWLNRFIGALVE